MSQREQVEEFELFKLQNQDRAKELKSKQEESKS